MEVKKNSNNVLPEIVVNGVNLKNKSPYERVKYKASGKPLYWTDLPIEYTRGFNNGIYPYTTTIGTDFLGNKFEIPTSTDKRQANILARQSFDRVSGRINDLTPETTLALFSLGTGSGRKLITNIAKGISSPVTNPAKAFWKGGIKAGAESALKEAGMLAGGIAGSEIGGKIGNQINNEYGSIIGSLIGSLPGGYLGRGLGNALNPKVQKSITRNNAKLLEEVWLHDEAKFKNGKYLLYNLLNNPSKYNKHLKVYNNANKRGRLSLFDALDSILKNEGRGLLHSARTPSNIVTNRDVLREANSYLDAKFVTTDNPKKHLFKNALRMRTDPDLLYANSILVNNPTVEGTELAYTLDGLHSYIVNPGDIYRQFKSHKFSPYPKKIGESIRNFEKYMDEIIGKPYTLHKANLNSRELHSNIIDIVGSPEYEYIQNLLKRNGISESNLPEFSMSDYYDGKGFNIGKLPIFNETTNVPITRAFRGVHALSDALNTRKIRSTFNGTMSDAENRFTVNRFIHSGIDGSISSEEILDPGFNAPMHIRTSPEIMSPNYAIGYRNPYFTNNSSSGVGGNDFMFILGRKGFPKDMGVRQVDHGGESRHFIADYGYDTYGKMLSDKKAILPYLSKNNIDKMRLFQVSPFRKIDDKFGEYILPSIGENDLIFSKKRIGTINSTKSPNGKIISSVRKDLPITKIGFIDSDILSRLKH